MRRIQIYIEEQLDELLGSEAARAGVSKAALIREAVALRYRDSARLADPLDGFVDAVTRSPRLAIEHASEAVESEAWDWLQRHDERPYSFVDATSFASMRRRRLTEALAFDGDFRAAGFVELRP